MRPGSNTGYANDNDQSLEKMKKLSSILDRNFWDFPQNYIGSNLIDSKKGIIHQNPFRVCPWHHYLEKMDNKKKVADKIFEPVRTEWHFLSSWHGRKTASTSLGERFEIECRDGRQQFSSHSYRKINQSIRWRNGLLDSRWDRRLIAKWNGQRDKKMIIFVTH